MKSVSDCMNVNFDDFQSKGVSYLNRISVNEEKKDPEGMMRKDGQKQSAM